MRTHPPVWPLRSHPGASPRLPIKHTYQCQECPSFFILSSQQWEARLRARGEWAAARTPSRDCHRRALRNEPCHLCRRRVHSRGLVFPHRCSPFWAGSPPPAQQPGSTGVASGVGETPGPAPGFWGFPQPGWDELSAPPSRGRHGGPRCATGSK